MNAALATARLDSLQSGLGREGGREGIEAYTEVKTVSIGL